MAKKMTFKERPITTVHELKCAPYPFSQIKGGRKSFEVRSTKDREFKTGDILVLFPYSTEECAIQCDQNDYGYIGKPIVRIVGEIVLGGWFNLPKGFAAMELLPIDDPRRE